MPRQPDHFALMRDALIQTQRELSLLAKRWDEFGPERLRHALIELVEEVINPSLHPKGNNQ